MTLNHACLPIPPLRHTDIIGYFTTWSFIQPTTKLLRVRKNPQFQTPYPPSYSHIYSHMVVNTEVIKRSQVMQKVYLKLWFLSTDKFITPILFLEYRFDLFQKPLCIQYSCTFPFLNLPDFLLNPLNSGIYLVFLINEPIRNQSETPTHHPLNPSSFFSCD